MRSHFNYTDELVIDIFSLVDMPFDSARKYNFLVQNLSKSRINCKRSRV